MVKRAFGRDIITHSIGLFASGYIELSYGIIMKTLVFKFCIHQSRKTE